MISPMNFPTLILLLGLINMVHSKGGRGSSRGGSSYRASTYRASYGYRAGSYRLTNLRTWSTSQKAAAIAIGAVYISSRMRARYGSPDYYNSHDVRICRNVEKYPQYNGSSTVYGWFLCPIEKDENSYCCGSSDKEHCCDFWSSSNAIGAYVGFAFLGVGVVAGIVVLFLCCLKPKLLHKSRPAQSQVGNSTVTFSSQSNASANIQYNGGPPSYSYSNSAGPHTTIQPYPQQQYGVYPPIEYQSPPPSYSVSGGAAPM